jgi:predicted glycosyltransferase
VKKLNASARRISQLSNIISKLKPDLSIAFASPEAARTAFGLAIPHYTINDSPHATAVARLTVPLAYKLFSPAIISKEDWIRYGINPERIIQYNALDPIGWLRSFIPNPAILQELKLDSSKHVVVFRVEEAFAAYLLDRIPQKESVTIPIINKLVENYQESLQIVVLPRYTEQIQALKAIFQERVMVPRRIIDGPSLLFFTSIFVGAGGTMTAEAALLGTPAISCYPREPTIIENYLIREKLVYREREPNKIVKKISQIIDNIADTRKKHREISRRLISKMEDPIEVIINEVEREREL